MPTDPPVTVLLGPDQWTAITDSWQVLQFGLGLCVFLLAVVAVGSFRR